MRIFKVYSDSFNACPSFEFEQYAVPNFEKSSVFSQKYSIEDFEYLIINSDSAISIIQSTTKFQPSFVIYWSY